jgi:hypothetical protein
MPWSEDDLVALLNRALSAPIKLAYGDGRLAALERNRLYWARMRARHRARPDRFSAAPPIPLDQLVLRIRNGDLYIGCGAVLNAVPQTGLARQRPRPPEQPVSLTELAGFDYWPPPGARWRRPRTRDEAL